MRYIEYFRIGVVHPYYEDGPVDLVLVPQKETLKRLKGQRLLLKKTKKGIKVLIPVNEEGVVIPIIAANDSFAFDVFPTADDFKEFTRHPEDERHLLFFTNEGLEEGEQALKTSEAAGGGVLNGFPAVAKVAIKAGEIDPDDAPAYQVVFEPKSAKWRYYFIANPGTDDFVIEDRNNGLSFHEVTIESTTTDRVATSLKLNYPDTRLVVFESGTSITHRIGAIKNIQLIQNGNVLIRHLPNPEVREDGIRIL